ncbi:MAG: hypothetical protein Q8L64_01735 [bacterium]|nr:hypothetical protein [bacterium]
MRYFVSVKYWKRTGGWGRKFVASEVAPKGEFYEVDEQMLKSYKRECRPTKRAVDLLSGVAKSAGLAQPANH